MNSPASNLVQAFIRTIVPYVVALIVTTLGDIGVAVDSVAVAQVVTAALAALYYVIVRLLGQIDPRFEYLLVVPAKPSYGSSS